MIFRPLSRIGALCATLSLSLSACKGIEGEIIDLNFNDGETGDESDTGVSTSTASSVGDGDGDPGDGDGDQGDGDGDPGGDGDGDGDGEPGDGDGDDPDGGDGDGDGDHSCDPFAPQELVAGPNMVSIGDDPSQLMGSCGANGPEGVFFYTATADALVQFAVTSSDMDVAMYIVEECEPIEEIACVADPDPLLIEQLMTNGQTYHIVLDSLAAGGNVVIEIN